MNQTQIQKHIMTEIKSAEFNRLESYSEKTKRVDLILSRLPLFSFDSGTGRISFWFKMGLFN